MRLYVIRHAEAAPLGQAGIDRDEDRPLTAAGLEQSRRLGLALKKQGVTDQQIETMLVHNPRKIFENQRTY